MTTANILGNLFPSVSDIPEKYRLDAQVEQHEYLVDGQLRRWDGPLAQVRSPVYLKGDNGDEQVILGSTPLLDAEAALSALDAAVRAYANGQGAMIARADGELRKLAETLNAPVTSTLLGKGVRAVQDGETVLGKGVGSMVARGLGSTRGAAEHLTDRELEVIRAVAAGLSNKQIAHQAFISESTVKFHLQNASRKLNAHRRAEIVHRASAAGLL